MDAGTILDALRPLVLVVGPDGTIHDARGANGGFFGHDVPGAVGRTVFDFVDPADVEDLVVYFLESADRSADARSLPLPFRVRMTGADGLAHPVDIIPAACAGDGDDLRWVVTVVPMALQSSVARSLEAEMSGAPRERVKELLAEELLVENDAYSTRWFLVDLTPVTGPTVTTALRDDRPMADAVRAAVVGHGWRPWGEVAPGATAPLDVAALPSVVRDVATARGWRRASVTPVHVDGAPAAAYLLFGRVPADYDVTAVNANVLSRIHRLVDATALLITRWHDRDRLVTAATRDPLTGLANRDAFADALAGIEGRAAVLYLDVDHFKAINDRHGHTVGDEVLTEIGRRVTAACRPADIVARFGGDELVVLLPGVTDTEGQAIAERILDSVRAPIAATDPPVEVTVSLGLAELTEDHDGAIDAADHAMLQAKRDGRGRVRRADDAGYVRERER